MNSSAYAYLLWLEERGLSFPLESADEPKLAHFQTQQETINSENCDPTLQLSPAESALLDRIIKSCFAEYRTQVRRWRGAPAILLSRASDPTNAVRGVLTFSDSALDAKPAAEQSAEPPCEVLHAAAPGLAAVLQHAEAKRQTWSSIQVLQSSLTQHQQHL